MYTYTHNTYVHIVFTYDNNITLGSKDPTKGILDKPFICEISLSLSLSLYIYIFVHLYIYIYIYMYIHIQYDYISTGSKDVFKGIPDKPFMFFYYSSYRI